MSIIGARKRAISEPRDALASQLEKSSISPAKVQAILLIKHARTVSDFLFTLVSQACCFTTFYTLHLLLFAWFNLKNVLASCFDCVKGAFKRSISCAVVLVVHLTNPDKDFVVLLQARPHLWSISWRGTILASTLALNPLRTDLLWSWRAWRRGEPRAIHWLCSLINLSR